MKIQYLIIAFIFIAFPLFAQNVIDNTEQDKETEVRGVNLILTVQQTFLLLVVAI